MKWERARFSELFRVKHGYAFKSQFFDSIGPYVLLTPGNFHEEGGFRDQGEKQKHYTGDVPPGFILNEGDLLVAMTEQADGLLGSSAWIPESNRYLHNQRLGLVVDLNEERIDKRYLYYLFNTREVRHQISGSASGTKVKHTAPERIGRVEVGIPPLSAQQKIATTVTAYDDLMENNRRRMELLEEAARQFYREWFVRLRFPGREHIRFINGVPEGWERKPLGEILTLNYGKALKESDRLEGTVPVYGSSGMVGTHNEPLVKGPAIIVGRKGNVGSVFWCDTSLWPIDTVYFVSSEQSSLFIYHCLQNLPFQNSDGAVPGLNRAHAHSLHALLPNKTLLSQFEEITTPMFEQLSKLRMMNDKLQAARDLLLPKLMSGEITVWVPSLQPTSGR